MKRATIPLLAVVGLVLVGWIAYHFGAFNFLLGSRGPGEKGASSSTTAGPGDQSVEGRQVVALGRTEPAGGIIDIAGLPGDRVDAILVEEGQRVAKDEVLARLESNSMRKLEYEAVSSQVEEAEARYEAEEKLALARIIGADLAVQRAETTDLDIKAQQEKVNLAKANLALAAKDLERLEGLKEERKGLVSAQEEDRQRLLVQQAEAELAAGEAMLEKLTRTRQLALDAGEADAAAARASKDQVLSAIPVKSLRKQRDLARKQYEKTEIKAPCDGTVLKVFMRPGETITQRPVLQMGDLTSMVVVAEVYETDVRWVRPGQTVLIESKAFAPPYDEKGLVGTVERIAEMITTPELKNLDPMASADRRVLEVRVLLDPEGSKRAAGLVNLQVDVTIQPEGSEDRSSDLPQEP